MTGHIHIVEDDEAVRVSLVALASLRKGVTVHSYPSAEAFLACVEAPQSGSSGVLLLDFRMPGISGLDVLATLGRAPLRFVTIMLTGYGDIALAIRAMKAGAFDFLEKPVTPRRLQSAIDAALEHFGAFEVAHGRVRRARDLIATLSARERDVLLGLMEGKPNKVIAHRFGISPRTIEIHRARLMDKMGVDSLSEALRIAFEAGLLEPVAP